MKHFTVNTQVLGDIITEIIESPHVDTDTHVGLDTNYGAIQLSDSAFFEVESTVNTYTPTDAEKIALDHLARWQYRNTEGIVRTAIASLSAYLYLTVNIRNTASRTMRPAKKTENLSQIYNDLCQEKPEYIIHLLRRAVIGNTHLEAMLPLAKHMDSYAWLESLTDTQDKEIIDTCVNWSLSTSTGQQIAKGASVSTNEYSARRLIQIVKSVSEYRTNHTASSNLRSFLLSVSSLTMMCRMTYKEKSDADILASDVQGLVNATDRLLVSNSVHAYNLINEHQSRRKINYFDMIELSKLQHRVTAGEVSLVFGLFAHFLAAIREVMSSQKGHLLNTAVNDLLRKYGVFNLYLQDQAENQY